MEKPDERPPPSTPPARDAAAASGSPSDAAARSDFSSDTTIPRFARDFPENAELARAVDAFARGNFAEATRRARALMASTADEAVRRAAEEVVRRTRPDPLAGVLLALTAALLVGLSAYWILREHEHPPPRAPRAAPTSSAAVDAR